MSLSMSLRLRGLALLPLLFALACGGDQGPEPARATAITLAGGTTTGAAGDALTSAPTVVVLDQRNQPMPGVPLSITVSSGTLSGAPTSSGASAIPIGTWTLGTAPGPQTLTVSSGTLTPATLTVTVAPGPPARITLRSPSATPPVGSTPAIDGTVTDRFDNPTPSISLLVDLTRTGAAATPAPVTTDAQGAFRASADAGTVKGAAQWTVAVAQAPTVRTTFAVRIIPGAASEILVEQAPTTARANTSAGAGRLLLRDRFGNGAEDPVRFTVTSGGGAIAAPTVTPDGDGRVTVPTWTLGRLAQPQVLRATTGTVFVDLTTAVQTDFAIDVRFFGAPMTDAQRALFRDAAARWSGAIVGDLSDVRFSNVDIATGCGIRGVAPLTEIVDDLVIYAAVQPIDGPGGTLARAGPCYVRTSGFLLPVLGIMEFDEADIAQMTANGSLERVIAHEMGHVLGIGTYWDVWGHVTGLSGTDPIYVGVSGLAACRALTSGPTTCLRGVPVENTGGRGTFGGHWRTSVFRTEMMVGYVNASMLLSTVSIASLTDIGYRVHGDAAEDYRFPTASLLAPGRALVQGAWEEPRGPVRLITPEGTVVRELPITEALRRSAMPR